MTMKHQGGDRVEAVVEDEPRAPGRLDRAARELLGHLPCVGEEAESRVVGEDLLPPRGERHSRTQASGTRVTQA
jgi:hypothetical protein